MVSDRDVSCVGHLFFMQLHSFFMLRFHFSCIENDAHFFDHLFRVFYMSKNMDLPENQLFAHLFFEKN